MDVRLLLFAAIPFTVPSVCAVQVGVLFRCIRCAYVPGAGGRAESVDAETAVAGGAFVGVFDLVPVLP